MTVKRNLVFSLPDTLMAKVFEYDNTFRIFGSSEFKKDLQYGWLKKQTSYARLNVFDLIDLYLDDDYDWVFKNEYCYIAHYEHSFGSRVFVQNPDFMVYIPPPKNNVLYYKILPKEFINKPDSFFRNLRFDGFFTHTDETIFPSLYRYVRHVDFVEWYATPEGPRAPSMYRNIHFYF